jgi:hypothetical protein
VRRDEFPPVVLDHMERRTDDPAALMEIRRLRAIPNCCGSEDGDLAVGVDLGVAESVMVKAWRCNTCGVITITDSGTTTNPGA